LKFDPEVEPILEHIRKSFDVAETREYAFTHAINFYNRKKYFEAHEVFEFQWKKETGSQKIFIQALIQISVAMNKLFVNLNLKGAFSQTKLALEKLQYIHTTHSLSEEKSAYVLSLIQNLKELVNLLEKGSGDYSNYSAPVLSVELFDFLS
jgi:hypothetical protein